jgi:hypothetical protein
VTALQFYGGLPDCPECMDHVDNHPYLVGACASVGIERGKSTAQMFREYIVNYHFGGHETAPHL